MLQRDENGEISTCGIFLLVSEIYGHNITYRNHSVLNTRSAWCRWQFEGRGFTDNFFGGGTA